MSQVEVTRLQWAGKNLKVLGPIVIQPDEIVAQAETDSHTVLYLRSGEKLLVQEPLEEIERLTLLTETQRQVLKRFKREMRDCKASGVPVSQAFAGLWEEISTEVKLSEGEQAELYRELLEWTKRWLK